MFGALGLLLTLIYIITLFEVFNYDRTNVFIVVYIKPTIVTIHRKKNAFLLFRQKEWT